MKRQTLFLALLVIAMAFRPSRQAETILGGQAAPAEPGRIVGVATRAGTADPLPDVVITVQPDNTGQPAQPAQGAAGARASGAVLVEGGVVLTLAQQRGLAAAQQLRATTDATGQFVIENVRPGRYIVNAQLEGYFAPGPSGSPPVNAMRVNVTVTSNNAAEVRLPLIPGAVISGRVLDPRGRAVVETQVQAMRLTYQADGTAGLQAYGGRPTDDRGDYRIFRLPPGEYYLVANPRNTAPVEPGVREVQMRTFYPSAVTPALGVPIAITGGEEIIGSNIQIRNVALAKISGRVVHAIPISAFDPPAARGGRGEQASAQALAAAQAASLQSQTGNDPALQPLVDEVLKAQAAVQAANQMRQDAQGRLQEARGLRGNNLPQNAPRALPVVQLQLVPRDRNALVDPNTASRTISAQLALPNDGRFEIPNVTPGSYDLYASLPDNTAYGPQQPPGVGTAGRSFGRVAIDVGDVDISDVSITVHQGVDVSGRLIVDGRPAAFPNAHIVLQPDDSAVRIPVYQQVGRSEALIAADGSFTIPAVPEAVYRVSVTLGGMSPAQRGRGNALDQSMIMEIEWQLQSGGNLQELLAAARGRTAAQASAPVPNAYVADVRQNSASIYDGVLVIGAGTVNGLDVHVETSAGSVVGTVLGTDRKPFSGATVVLTPHASRRGNPALYRNATADAEGKFKIEGLGPGEFKLFAWQALTGTPYLNPAFLSFYEERGVPVSIFVGGQVTADVSLIPESIGTVAFRDAVLTIDALR